MPVELEEVALFGLFKRNRNTIQIREEHFKDISVILQELTPIPIDFQKLHSLGFLRYPTGIYYRQHGTIEFLLRPLKDGRWELSLDGGNRLRIVSYIHQIQRLWFDLFDDHLFVPKTAQPRTPKKRR